MAEIRAMSEIRAITVQMGKIFTVSYFCPKDREEIWVEEGNIFFLHLQLTHGTRELGHTTLEERRHQLDMQQVHRILAGSDKVKSKTWLKWSVIWKE
jgi:hypothetical protein